MLETFITEIMIQSLTYLPIEIQTATLLSLLLFLAGQCIMLRKCDALYKKWCLAIKP